jgi:hypothetical protein
MRTWIGRLDQLALWAVPVAVIVGWVVAILWLKPP